MLVTVRVGNATTQGLAEKNEGYTNRQTRDANITAGDEGACNGEDLAGLEGNVECGGDGSTSGKNIEHRLVARLDCQDGGGSIQKDRIGNESGPTQVGTDTDVLDHARSSSHGRYITQHRAEVKLATTDRLFPECLQLCLRVNVSD